MKLVLPFQLSIVLVAVFISGCPDKKVEGGDNGSPAVHPAETVRPTFPDKALASAPDVVKRSISALGDPEKWRPVRRIEGEVSMCMYGEWGNPYICRFRVRMVFDPGLVPKRLIARSLSDRKLRIDLDERGRDSAPRYAQDHLLQKEVGRAFYMYMLKFTGPWHLLTGRKMKVTGGCRIEGVDLNRVGVGRGAYYFKPDTGLLRYVTTGTDKPGKEGLVTSYQYEMQGAGMAIPKNILINRIGRHVLIGVEKVIEAELFDVEFFHTVE